MSTWPTSLPRPLVNGYAINPADQTLRTDMEAGAARVRRRSAARLDMFDIGWKFTDAQMDLFRTWFENDGTVTATGTAQDGSAIHSGTAQAGAASTITLAAGASATDDYYNDATITITGGTGSGQARTISGYVGATKVATVSAAWTTPPDATSTYTVSAGASGILLASGESATADYYANCTLTITGGTGSGQTRTISGYNGNLKLATVDVAWTTEPDATSTYDISGGAAGGASWFTVDLASGDTGVDSKEARFSGPFKAAMLPGMNWSVTAKLEVR